MSARPAVQSGRDPLTGDQSGARHGPLPPFIRRGDINLAPVVVARCGKHITSNESHCQHRGSSWSPAVIHRHVYLVGDQLNLNYVPLGRTGGNWP